LKINVEQSIKGLWLATGNEGYLESWFPRLRTKTGRLIPLSPGINVFYGRNGAGKTQMLEAIAYAADYKMSAYEGFVLHNPTVSRIKPDYGTERFVFDISPEELLSKYESMDTEELWLGWTPAFDPEKITLEHRELVLGILGEFISAKNVLLTREPHQDEPGPEDPSKMNPPEFVQLVPMIFSNDQAPLTRIHVQEIYSSFLEFSEMIESKGRSDEDPDLSVEENNRIWTKESEEFNRLFTEWVAEWAWSPLINLRNLGWDFNYSAGADGVDVKLWSGENLPIFLPSIISYDAKPEYQEFSDSISRSVSLSLTRESEITPTPNYFRRENSEDPLSEINFVDIKYRNKDYKSTGVDQPDIYKKLLSDYLERLRSKLFFLPNFRTLKTAEFRESNKTAILLINNNVRPSYGSSAERRWLKLARETMRSLTQWVVIDEPEAGLHRTAEAELANALASPEWNRGSVEVVATHSPEFLDIPNAHILHIDGGIVRELTQIDREDLISLGLRPGDLLTQIRIFLLVEGEHERIIFENMFEEELRRAGCKIIVARGAKNMKDIFESQMIFNFSDATIVSLLDNIRSAEVHSIWTEAKKLANSGKLIESGQYVRSALPRDKSGENVFLSQFLTLALSYGQYERVEVWGLSKPDILQYFDPSCFGLTRNWEELNALHTNSDPSFKVWASKKYGADFDVRAIDSASHSLDSIPDEFGDLMMRISELSRRV